MHSIGIINCIMHNKLNNYTNSMIIKSTKNLGYIYYLELF